MLFKIIGMLVALYAICAALSGQVFAKSGAWGKTILRSEAPVEFWMTIVIYAGLAVALAKSGRTQEALEHVKRALALDPDFGPARDNLARLTRGK